MKRLLEVPARIYCLMLLALLIHEYTRPSLVNTIEKAMQGVVIIECNVENATITTAGFVSSKYGHISTVAHGLEECRGDKEKNIVVRFRENPYIAYKAHLVRYNRALDLAVLQVPLGQHVCPLKIDSSLELYPGEEVVALGHPGLLYWSAASGIVSADRLLTHPLRHAIQVSAPITRGNSGGPVINTKGRVIGVVSFTAGNVATLSFIVPGDILLQFLNGI